MASQTNVLSTHKANILTNGRTFQVSLSSTAASTAFDGSANISDIGVDGTLAVTNGGTGIATSSYKNAIITGSVTAATNKFSVVRTGSGAFYATAQDGAAKFGTLPVPQGGTGMTTATNKNAIVTGNSTTANGNFTTVRTGSGAFYATTADGAATFGTLPVQQGGTGLTSSSYKNAIIAGNATTATSTFSTIRTGSGALYSTTADGAATFGTLPVPQGGTGMITATNKNAIITGNSTTANAAFASIRTGSGAFYATGQDNAAQFGTLPVPQGGTGTASFTKNSAIISGSTTTAALTTRTITNITTAATNPTANTDLITANTLMNYKGTTNISTLGTISSGTWHGTAVGVGYGGTGKTEWTKGGIIYASTTSALAQIADGTADKVLKCSGSASYSWLAYTSSNTASTIVSRDASGNFSGGTISATTLKATGTTDTSSADTGVLQVSGGAGIAKKLYVGSHTYLNGYIYGRAKRYPIDWMGYPFYNHASSPNTSIGCEFWYDAGNADKYSNPRFLFRQYSYTADTTTPLSTYENFRLPATAAGLEANATYEIRTSKSSNYTVDKAAALTSNAGGTEQPIYFTGGVPSATSYALKATVNNSTAGYMAYYSADRAVSGTSNIRATSNGALSIFPTGGSYRDGIRIHARSSDSTWAAVVLCGSDNTGDSGTSANTWFIGANGGDLYFGKNGTGSSGTYLRNVSGTWAWNGTATGSVSGSSGSCTGNAATCTTANGLASLVYSTRANHSGDTGVIVQNTDSTNPLKIGYIIGSSGNAGIYDFTHSAWKVQIAPNGTTTFNGASTSCSGNAATASKVGEAASWLYCHHSNEVNFGGTYNSNAYIYFGYRAVDSRAQPTDYYFGSGNGTANLHCNRVFAVSATDAAGNAANAVALVVGGVQTAAHMEMDSNEIIAKSNGTTKVSLWLNENCEVTSDGKVKNAVWNDYAEYRQTDIIDPGYCVATQEDGIMHITNSRMYPGAHIVSDTFGHAIGMSDTAKTPIAVAGRVLVYPYQNRNNYHIGDCVCATYDGKVDIMTREEIKEYPDRIIGIVDEIPSYEYWEQSYTFYKTKEKIKSQIKVNGRIWIYVR